MGFQPFFFLVFKTIPQTFPCPEGHLFTLMSPYVRADMLSDRIKSADMLSANLWFYVRADMLSDRNNSADMLSANLWFYVRADMLSDRIKSADMLSANLWFSAI